MAFVCDLFFFEAGTAITSATGPAVADGAVSVSALSPTGTPKYNLNSDFTYASGGQLSGFFSSLVPGTYTVYSRTNDTCLKTLQVVIPYIVTYTPRYRLQHGTEIVTGITFRFDIEDRDFSGSVEDVIGADDALQLHWINEGAQDIFLPVIGSEVRVGLISPTNFYFDVLTTNDEKRFRGTLYVNVNGGGYVQKWQGFLVTQNNSEPYCEQFNYPVYFSFKDGLADLVQFPFSDDSGNAPTSRLSFFEAIVFCLNKTGLELNIWDTVGIIAVSMNPTLSTLKQLYFDPEVYMGDDGIMEDSLTVLSSLLKNLGARVSQSNGVWSIESVTLKSGNGTSTRKFTSNGGSLGTNTEFYRIMLRKGTAVAPKLTFQECSGTRTFGPAYGKLKFIYNLSIEQENNALVVSEFEDEDIENGQLKGYQITDSNAAGQVTETIEPDNERPGFNKLKIEFDNIQTTGVSERYIILSSQIISFDAPAEASRLRLSFDVYTKPMLIGTPYLFFDYSIEFIDSNPDTYYLLPSTLANNQNQQIFGTGTGATDTLIDGLYNRIFVTEHNTWKTITVDIELPESGVPVDYPSTFQINFRIPRNTYYEHPTVGDMAAEDIVSSSTYQTTAGLNNKRRVLDTIGLQRLIRYYELEPGDQAESIPEIIEPNSGGGYRWIQKSTTPALDGSPTFWEAWMASIEMRRVRLEYFPENGEPETQVVSEILISENITPLLEIVFRHGDIPDDGNYKHIARGWLSFDDGDPTERWNFRTASSPGLSGFPLMELLRRMYQGQYTVERPKLQGDLALKEVIAYLGNQIYEVATGKIYIPVSGNLMTHQGAETLEFIEVLRGAAVIDEGADPDPDVEPPVDISDFAAVDYDGDDFYTSES